MLPILFSIALACSIFEYGYALKPIHDYNYIVFNLFINKYNHDEPFFKDAPEFITKLVNLSLQIIWVGANCFHIGLLLSSCYLLFQTIHQLTLPTMCLNLMVISFAIYDYVHSTRHVVKHLPIPNYYQDQFLKYENIDDKKPYRK